MAACSSRVNYVGYCIDEGKMLTHSVSIREHSNWFGVAGKLNEKKKVKRL